MRPGPASTLAVLAGSTVLLLASLIYARFCGQSYLALAPSFRVCSGFNEACSTVVSREVSSIGLSDEIAQHLAAHQNPNCVWDSYRRLIVSYAQVVHHLDSAPFEQALERVTEALDARDRLGRKHEVWQIPTNDLQQLVETYKEIYQQQTGDAFPQDPCVQLQKAVEAVHSTGPDSELFWSMLLFPAAGFP